MSTCPVYRIAIAMKQLSIDPKSPIPRYYQLYNFLRGRIRAGEFQAGDALPSERQLVQDYGVSRITVVKAIDTLEKDGLIERQHGRGNFVTQPGEKLKTSQRTKVAFIVPQILDSFIMAILNGAIKLAHKNQIYVQVVSAFGAEDEEAIIDDLIAHEVHGILAYPRTGFNNIDIYAQLQQNDFPLVMIDRYYPDLETDRVVFEDERAGYELTKLLIDQGHERIVALPGHEVSVTSIINRLNGYRRALEENGLSYNEEFVWLDIYKILDQKSQTIGESCHTYLDLRERIDKYDPSAFLGLNNQVVEQVHADLMTINRQRMQKALQGNSKEITLDSEIKVSGISFQRILHNDGSVVATAIQDGILMGEKATDLLIQRMSGKTSQMPLSITIPMQIQVNEEQPG